MIADTEDLRSEVRAAFPVHYARNLMFESVYLPDDFEGEVNLVLIAFKMRQQADVDSWVPFSRLWESTDPSFRFYEVPVIQYMLPIYHDFIDKGMARGIRDLDARHRTITLYTNLRRFLRELGLPSDNEIAVLLVDGEGQILARANGAYTGQKADELIAAARMARRQRSDTMD